MSKNEDSNYDEHFWNEMHRGTIEGNRPVDNQKLFQITFAIEHVPLLLQQCVISLTEKQSFLTIHEDN